jgi:hypothetical protein
MYKRLYVKHPLFLSTFNKTLIFSTDFRKILKYKMSWKSVYWEPRRSIWAEGQTDRQTDMTNLTIAFQSFAKADWVLYLPSRDVNYVISGLLKSFTDLCISFKLLGAGLTLGFSGLDLAFWRPGREITMAAPNRNYELKT